MSIRYVIRDSHGRYIMKNAANQFVPVGDIALAEQYDSITKAKNILNSCINKNLRKRMIVEEIELNEVTKKSPEENSDAAYMNIRTNKNDEILKKLIAESSDTDDHDLSEQQLIDIIGTVDTIRQRKIDLQEKHSVVDKEIIDIEHYIEFSDLNAYQGWLAYMLLRKRLRVRRKIKDEIMALAELDGIMNSLKKTASQYGGANGRSYQPRILKDLFS